MKYEIDVSYFDKIQVGKIKDEMERMRFSLIRDIDGAVRGETVIDIENEDWFRVDIKKNMKEYAKSIIFRSK